MNISTLKALIVLGSLGVAGYLGYFMYQTFQSWDEVTKSLDEPKQRQFLEPRAVEEEKRDDLIDYASVLRTFHELDWTGKPEAKPVEVPVGPNEPPEQKVVPIDDLLEVLYIQVDTNRPERSIAYVRYGPELLQGRTAARAAAAGGGGRGGRGGAAPAVAPEAVLRVGEHLPPPHAFAHVEEIVVDGVRFAFEDEAREHELVPTEPFNIGGGIVKVGPGGAILPTPGEAIPKTGSDVQWRPERTTLVGPNRYRIGTEDKTKIGDDYARILTEQVRYREWHDPQTGRRAGIQIDYVQPGSLAAQHGAQSGDVIISINGNPVSSSSEAIAYVKNNAETTSIWEVVVMNRGKTRTMIFESPPE